MTLWVQGTREISGDPAPLRGKLQERRWFVVFFFFFPFFFISPPEKQKDIEGKKASRGSRGKRLPLLSLW